MVGEAPALQLALRWLGLRTTAPAARSASCSACAEHSHGAARIMIELRNKHTLTGKHAAFRSYFARSSAAIFLAKA
jgi:hypothetical protein